MTRSIDRRTVLAGGAAGLAGVAMAGCSNEGRGSDAAAPGGGATAPGANQVLPSYQPYQDVPADLEGSDGVADAYFSYPADPIVAIADPPGDGDPITTMGITNTPIPPALEENDFWQDLDERLGSPLQVALYNPSDYRNRFPTAVAGDQLTDIWSVGPSPQRPQMLEAKALDLTEHLAGDAVADFPFLANIPTDSWKSCVFNGRIYAIPVPRGVFSTGVLYARDDLLAEQGITRGPESYQDFVDMCAHVTAPGSNVWALSRVPTDYVRQMYGVPNGWELQEDGTLVSAYEHPGQKEALEGCRRLVEAGYTNPDTFSTQFQNYQIWLANGTTFFTTGTFSAWTGYYELRSGGRDDFSVTAYGPPQAQGGGAASAWLGNPTNSITALNKNAADRVRTLLQVMNWMATPFGTAEYLFRKYGTRGVQHVLDGTDPILTDQGRSELQLGLLYLTDAPWPIYQPGLPDVTQDQYDAQTAIVSSALADPTTGLYSEADSRHGGQINGALRVVENDIIQGRQPVSAWDEAVATWKKDGGDEIRDEYQAALEASR